MPETGLFMRSFIVSFLLITAASCTDLSSNVGLDLLGDETDPQINTVPITSLSPSTLPDITGAVSRVLVGSVNDPLTGKISANGFLDFTGSFAGSPSEVITSVQLKLSRNYSFGDTLAPVQFQLHQILDAWDQNGLHPDTTLEIGPEITSVLTRDTLVVIDLPFSWITANTEILQSNDFGEAFHGFALIEYRSRQVVGINAASTVLEMISSNRSTTYTVSSTYTQIKRTRSASIPDGFVLFQDGVGPSVELALELDEFMGQPIHSAVLSFKADTAPYQMETPSSFFRPIPLTMQLVAVPEDHTSPVILVGQATLDDHGSYRFAGRDMNLFFQGVLLGEYAYDRLELRAPVLDHSLDAVLLHKTDARTTIIRSS